MKSILKVTLGTALALSVGCGSMTAADCQLQASANGPYAIKFTQAGAGTGCTPTTGPDVFGDLWQFDPFEAGLIVGFSALNSTLPFPPDPTSPVFGRGKFNAQFPDSNDLCTIPSLTTMQIDANQSYAVTNMQFLSTAVYLGTEFKGDVAYTNGSCSRPYTIQALNPTHTCAAKEDCDPFAQPFASGINSNFNTDCNKDAWATTLAEAVIGSADYAGEGICFLVGAFPSNDGWKPVQ